MRPPKTLFRGRYPLAIAAGMLLAAAFPGVGMAGLAWVAPGMMVGAAVGKQGVERFRIGYVAGLVYYLCLLYWLLFIPYRWHGIPLAPATGWLALSAFLALFPAAWVCLMAPSRSPGGILAGGADSLPHDSEPGVAQPGGVLARNWVVRTLWALGGAAAWIAWEMVLARIFGGFPWCLLGVSQYDMTPLIQIASVTGVYGVSFLVAWLSLSVLSAALIVVRRPTLRSAWLIEVFLPLIVLAIVFNFGLRRLRTETPEPRTVKLLLVQPSIPQTLIWDSAKDDERFQALIQLSQDALTNRPDILIWPESAVPKLVRYDKATFEAVASLARRHGCWLIIGSDDAEPHGDGTKAEEPDYFNSSFLIDPQGKLVSRYVKRNLVIFGEYVPLQRWLPFLGWFTPVQGGFTPGKEAVEFRMENPAVTTSVLICFEDTFPHLGRQSVTTNTDFLVNMTNDGWFGESAAPWQHASTALFRAVENGVPLVRCCNNGVTCWVDARGRLREVFRDDRGTVYGPGVLRIELPVLPANAPRETTVYNRHGDWFGWGCVIVAGFMALGRGAGLVQRFRHGS